MYFSNFQIEGGLLFTHRKSHLALNTHLDPCGTQASSLEMNMQKALTQISRTTYITSSPLDVMLVNIS